MERSPLFKDNSKKQLSISMSPEQSQVLTAVLAGVARFDGKEAALRLLDTLVQHILTAEDYVKLDAYKQSCHEFINDVAEAAAASAASATED